VVLTYIFVQLFVHQLCYCYTTPCWWSWEWPKHVGEELYVIEHIYKCAFVGSFI